MVIEVIACNGGEHDVSQPHGFNRIGNLLRFERVDGLRATFLHLAERAAARADRPPQQECCGAGGVTLTSVRAAPFLADGVKGVGLHQPLNPFDRRGLSQGATQPLW